jgi:hypothetical protein
MLKTMRLISVAAVAALALPALAGSWPPIAPRKATTKPAVVAAPAKPAAAATTAAAKPATAALAGFEQAGGDAGWQLVQHKYDFLDGKFTMSDECDHAVRIAQAPTPAEVESARRLSPGA